MEDAPVPEPERDVPLVADEIPGTELALGHLLAGLLLLVRVARDEPARPPIRHVHEPGAIDPALGHPAPEVRRAQVATGPLDRVVALDAPSSQGPPRRRAPPPAPSPDSRRPSGSAPTRPAAPRPSSGSPRSTCVTCSASSRGSARTGADVRAQLVRRRLIGGLADARVEDGLHRVRLDLART